MQPVSLLSNIEDPLSDWICLDNILYLSGCRTGYFHPVSGPVTAPSVSEEVEVPLTDNRATTNMHK